MKSYSKLLIGVLIIGIIGIAGGTFGYKYYQENVASGAVIHEKKPESSEKKKADEAAEQEVKLLSAEEKPEEVVYDEMHKMANTKIVAEDGEIWGEIPIDEESIKKVEDIINRVDYEDRGYLLDVLKRWKAGDFSQIVDEHNYVWEKLDGTVGKAVSAR